MLLGKTEIKLIHLNTFFLVGQKDIRLMQNIYDSKFPTYVLTKPKLIRIDRAPPPPPAPHNK